MQGAEGCEEDVGHRQEIENREMSEEEKKNRGVESPHPEPLDDLVTEPDSADPGC